MEEMDDGTEAKNGLVAVVGMAGRFPGAADIDALWSLLQQGREGIRRFSAEALRASGASQALIDDPAWVAAAGVVEDIALFDHWRFGYSPREAAQLDPQHRLFLECCLSALENSGHDPQRFAGWIGVFAGGGAPAYLLERAALAAGPFAGIPPIVMGSLPDFLAARVAYRLDLRGPVLDLQTACSTSLVSVHVACQNLLGMQCDLALAGGVSLALPPVVGYRYQPDSILSPDGHCRPFDARAAGTVPGSGCGVVVLRRLEDALADGDDVLAVIRGSAINNDGAAKVGFTAPSVAGQAQAIALAQAMAGVTADTITYVEAHGTATRLGDPIELRALAQAFAGVAGSAQCAIGSIKSNLGHLDTAAGIAGLIKTVLMLKHRTLVPTLHFVRPNPELQLEQTPFYVNTQLRPWERRCAELPLRAGVSSFGIGGTNAHVILEEAETRAAAPPSGRSLILPLAAKSESALTAMSAALAEHLETHPEAVLDDVAFTLQVGRPALEVRRAVVAVSADEACQELRRADAASPAVTAARQVAFLFPGQGAQHVGMGRLLDRELPIFRQTFARCAALLKASHGIDLAELLHGRQADAARLEQTAYAQPALFVVQYALARQWLAWGVKPEALLGHSIGEYAAACLAEVFPLEAALQLVAERGRLIQALPGGAMLSVQLAEEAVVPWLAGGLSLAAVNAPRLVTVAGPLAEIAQMEAALLAQQIPSRRLHTSHAFHSVMMEPVLEPFAQIVARLGPRPPVLPIVSGMTGAILTAEEARSPSYWAQQIRQPVRFFAGVKCLLASSQRALLELGPGRTLYRLLRRSLPAATVLCSAMPAPEASADEVNTVQSAAAELWSHGVELDFAAMHERPARRVALPGYAFQRTRCWLEPMHATAEKPLTDSPEPQTAENTSTSDTSSRPQLQTRFSAPRSALERRLAALWESELEVRPIGIDDDFFRLGGESLVAIRILMRLRSELAVALSLTRFLQHPTVAQLAELVAGGRPADGGVVAAAAVEHDARLVTLHVGQPGTPPLFVIHAAGGLVFNYAHLSRLLGDARPVYGIRALAADLQSPEPLSIERLAQRYLEIVESVQPTGPYLLLGASLGGLIAFEIAQQLHARKREVGAVFLLDTPEPSAMAALAQRIPTDADLERYITALLPASGPRNLAGELPPELRPSEFYAMFRRMAQDGSSYVPRAYPGRVVFFRAQERDPYNPPFPERSWIDLAAGGVEIHVVPGNHLTMMAQPHIAVTARHICKLIEPWKAKRT